MSDDAFAELERQLMEIASYGKKANAAAAANNASSDKPVSTTQTTNPRSSLIQNQQISQLQQEVEKWKNSAHEANERAQTCQDKLQKMVTAVKGGTDKFSSLTFLEERELQRQNEEGLERKAETAEARAEAVEEKLIKLVEIVKKDRAARASEAPAVNQVLLCPYLSNKFRIKLQSLTRKMVNFNKRSNA
jgi:hypothetical protein